MNGLISILSNTESARTRFEPGTPVPAGYIPLHVPEIRGNEWKYVKECLDSGWVSSAGSFVDRFEQELPAYVGSKHGVATSSGTAALHIALLVAGVKPGDEVLVSTLSFIAPANAIRYVGAWPVFIDADSDYWQMDAVKVVEFIETECRWHSGELVNKRSNRRVKAILPVHILGHPCDTDPILQVAQKYGLVVIEDATESLGAQYQGEMVGHLGHIACFSFNGNKLITTGGGGMVVTDNAEWAMRAKYLTTQAKDDPLEYIHGEIGYNYRLTNIQAALGCAQIEQLEFYIAAKRRIACAYSDALREIPGITLMMEAPWADSVFWLNTVLVDEPEYGMSSRSLIECLEAANIQVRPLWQPLHLSLPHSGSYTHGGTVAEHIHRDAISLPSSVGLQPEDQDRVIDVILKAQRGNLGA